MKWQPVTSLPLGLRLPFRVAVVSVTELVSSMATDGGGKARVNLPRLSTAAHMSVVGHETPSRKRAVSTNPPTVQAEAPPVGLVEETASRKPGEAEPTATQTEVDGHETLER